MNREEFNRKAEEYALEKCKECYMCNSVENGERGYCPKYESRIEGYITGATEETKELERENAELKSVLSKCYSKFFSNAFRTCDDDLLELKGQIKDLLKE